MKGETRNWRRRDALLSAVVFAGGALLFAGGTGGCSPAVVAAKKVLQEREQARTQARTRDAAAYQTVLSLWRAGSQGQAELRCAQARRASPNHQGLAFFEAACARSRFDVSAAHSLFAYVRALDPDTPAGRCADAIIVLDELRYPPGEAGSRTPPALPQNRLVPRRFGDLRGVARQNPDDPLLLWMLAVECRAFDRNVEGVTHYQTLLARIHPDPGPALVHQTYANLLDALKRPSDALPQRRLAVQLEPAPWSYDGLGATLCDLGRYEDANRAHEIALDLAARTGLESANYWRNWAFCLFKAADAAGPGAKSRKSHDQPLGTPNQIIPKIERALRLNPDDAVMWNLWGICLERQNKAREALPKYQRALTLNPKEPDFRDNAAQCLARVGRRREAAALSPDAAAFSLGPLTSLPESARLRIYRGEEALLKELFRKNKGGSVSGNDPTLAAFRKRHHLTQDEMAAIDTEGVAKRWYFTPAQRRRAHLPPLPR